MAQKATRKKTDTRRTANAALRRTAIINAALDEFVERGFAATRMEDIARRARVAKGTIYLNFTDKEALFEAIVKQEIRPEIDLVASHIASGVSLRDFVEHTFLPLLRELAETRRGAVLRLLIGEAGRFPKLAKVYYRLVIGPALEAIRTLVERAQQRGELSAGMLVQFPHLLVAPLPITVIWAGLFERFHHLDLEAMARAYFDLMLNGASTKPAFAPPKVRRASHE